MSLSTLQSIIDKASARLRCRPCRPRAALLPTLVALTIAVALTGCSDEGLTGTDRLSDAAAAEDFAAAEVVPPDAPAAGSSAATASATRLPKSLFVNPQLGSDANPGTQLKPFKTLAHGLSLAIAGDTMRLAFGVYSATSNGEKFTTSTQQIVVPAGVKIFGTLDDEFSRPQLKGTTGDLYGLNLNGAATVRNLTITGFNSAIRAKQGVQVLNDMALDHNILGLELSGSATATLTGSRVELAPRPNSAKTIMGAFVSQQARLTVVGGTIGGLVQNCSLDMRGVSLRDSAQATLKGGAILKNIAGMGVATFGASKATLTGLSTIDRNLSQLPGCSPSANVFATDFSTLTLKNARVFSSGGTKANGIVANTSGLITLDSAQVKGHTGAGLKSILDLRLVATSSVFQFNGIGIDVFNGPKSTITITGSTISNNGTGIHAPFFKLRKSLVTSNQTGILVATFSADLGQTGDPGNNLIAANSNTGVTWDASVISGGVGGIFASGNAWNPSTQGSDANGRYLLKPLVNNDSPVAFGKNFVLPTVDSNDLFQLQL
jgi:hypothetical protein